MRFSRVLITAVSSVLSLHVNGQAPLDQRMDALENKLGDLDKKLGDLDKKLDRLLSTPQRNDPQQSPSVPAKTSARGGSETSGAIPMPETRTFVSKPGAILSAYELPEGQNISTMQTGSGALFKFTDASSSFTTMNFLSQPPGPSFSKSSLGILWEGYLDILQETDYVFIVDATIKHYMLTPGRSNGQGILVTLGNANLFSGRTWSKGGCTSTPIALSKGRYELRVWMGKDRRTEDHKISLKYLPVGGSEPHDITPRSLLHEAEKVGK